jgi:hypothetical protein
VLPRAAGIYEGLGLGGKVDPTIGKLLDHSRKAASPPRSRSASPAAAARKHTKHKAKAAIPSLSVGIVISTRRKLGGHAPEAPAAQGAAAARQVADVVHQAETKLAPQAVSVRANDATEAATAEDSTDNVLSTLRSSFSAAQPCAVPTVATRQITATAPPALVPPGIAPPGIGSRSDIRPLLVIDEVPSGAGSGSAPSRPQSRATQPAQAAMQQEEATPQLHNHAPTDHAQEQPLGAEAGELHHHDLL